MLLPSAFHDDRTVHNDVFALVSHPLIPFPFFISFTVASLASRQFFSFSSHLISLMPPCQGHRTEVSRDSNHSITIV